VARGGREQPKRFSANRQRQLRLSEADAEAEAIAREAGAFIWNNFFVPFGFNAAIAGPGEGPFDPPPSFETLSDRGLVIHGSPDTVNRKLEKLLKDLPVDYFWMFIYNHMPQGECMKSLKLLTEKVWPNFSNRVGGSNVARLRAKA
jgi:alkanesulfonate monooxygenase SsuD/methylene tetrahydromethanopterin reductase-like flavin-dependent oxidoreductase (luciferase family)